MIFYSVFILDSNIISPGAKAPDFLKKGIFAPQPEGCGKSGESYATIGSIFLHWFENILQEDILHTKAADNFFVRHF